MAVFVPKASSSRINSPGTTYPWAGTGAQPSSAVGPETFQVRVISQLSGYITIGSSADPTIASTAGAGTFITANTANGDYFTCTPGQKVLFSSTTTSSASFWNMTEMS